MPISQNDAAQAIGTTMYDQSGDKVGKVGQIYLDDQSGDPQWATVSTGLFGSSESFVPLDSATLSGDKLTVPFEKAKIKDAPRVDADQHLSETEEDELYRYYGLTGGGTSSGDVSGRTDGRDIDGSAVGTAGYATTGTSQRDVTATDGHDTSGPNTDDAMTRSEERLNVGVQKREAGRARLRKYIVEENVSTTVPVTHEEIRVEREPITDANRGAAYSGGDLTEEVHEVTLTEEVPVVAKETVAVERVKIAKEAVTEQVQVNETLRKEQIVTEGVTDGDTAPRRNS